MYIKNMDACINAVMAPLRLIQNWWTVVH